MGQLKIRLSQPTPHNFIASCGVIARALSFENFIFHSGIHELYITGTCPLYIVHLALHAA
jgi:hypothetical protein